MQRRDFLILTAAVSLAAPMAFAADANIYSPELVAAELAAGKTVVLDFTASWCVSCQSQGRAIRALRDENPAYDKTITVVDVDWDTYKKTELTEKYGITNRGSLVFLRGDKVIAQTYSHSSKADLKAMLDQAAAAACAGHRGPCHAALHPIADGRVVRRGVIEPSIGRMHQQVGGRIGIAEQVGAVFQRVVQLCSKLWDTPEGRGQIGMTKPRCIENQHWFHHRPVPMQPTDVIAALRMANGAAKARIGEKISQILDNRATFADHRAIMDQQRHLAFGMRVGRVMSTTAILPQNGNGFDLDPVLDAHFINQRDNTGRTGVWGMDQG
jgi:thioredoxin 1